MSRIDTIGHNGGDGAHYDDPLYWRKRAENAETELQRLREQEPVAYLFNRSPYSYLTLTDAAAPKAIARTPDEYRGDAPNPYWEKAGPLYAAPVPPPDVRELVETFQSFLDWYEERSGDNECRPLENARTALAKFRGQS